MKYLSFKALILCIFLPPILYISSILLLENHLKGKYTDDIENSFTGNARALFDGSVRLKDAVRENIDTYLSGQSLTSLGVNPAISVFTQSGKIIYPAYFEEESPLLVTDPMKIAEENYRFMQDGLTVKVGLTIDHNTTISNAILCFYISIFVLFLSGYYRSSIKRARMEELEKNHRIENLLELEKEHTGQLEALAVNKEKLVSELEKMKMELKDVKIRASRNEEDMVEEIVSLEGKISENIHLQSEQLEEISQLKNKIERYEKQKDARQKSRSLGAVEKRFKALYKKVTIHKRAIDGFIDLEEDMKIKSEEVIHQLNDDPNMVPVKRKVFGKKNRETVFEVAFAYNGRLYYRKIQDSRIEVLSVGTKNTQPKDLEFIDNL